MLYCDKSACYQCQNSLSGFLHNEELNVKSCKITVLVIQKKDLCLRALVQPLWMVSQMYGRTEGQAEVASAHFHLIS